MVICNKCGCKFEDINHTEIDFGYGSEFDTETWEVNICDHCMKVIVKGFKVAPKGFKDDNHFPRLSREEHQDVFEGWKQTEKWETIKYLILEGQMTYEDLVEFQGFYSNDYINNFIEIYFPGKEVLY